MKSPTRIDLRSIESLDTLKMEGEPDLVCELIEIFKSTGPEKLKFMSKAFEKKEFRKVSEIAHSFKSTCQNVGAVIAANLCQELEDGAGSEKLEILYEEFDLAAKDLEEIAKRR